MDLSFYLYLFLVIASVLGGTYYFFKNNKSTTGSIYLVGSVVISAFFGSRWFLPSGTETSRGGTWPPLINVCPDFMSLVTITPTPAGTARAVPETVCVDTAGIYSGIARWTPGSTSEDTIFHLYTAQDPKDRLKSLCDESVRKRVTWEGFYTEGTCGTNLPPKPPA